MRAHYRLVKYKTPTPAKAQSRVMRAHYRLVKYKTPTPARV